MERLRRLTLADLDHSQHELHSEILHGPRAQEHGDSLAGTDGSLKGPFNAMLYAPAIGDALQALGAAIRYRSSLSDRMRELAILRVAHTRGSAFEVDVHAPLAAQAGVTSEELDGLGEGIVPETLSVEETTAIGLVDAVLRDAAIDERTYELWRTMLGEQALVELTALAGHYQLLAALMRVFDVE